MSGSGKQAGQLSAKRGSRSSRWHHADQGAGRHRLTPKLTKHGQGTEHELPYAATSQSPWRCLQTIDMAPILPRVCTPEFPASLHQALGDTH